MQNRDFSSAIGAMPIIASLRGIPESDAIDVGRVLVECGITVFEVPVRSRQTLFSDMESGALLSLKKLLDVYGRDVHVCAGTITRSEDLTILREIGMSVCLAPNFTPVVVSEAKRLGISFIPGVETVSEAISAVACGSSGVKIFPSVFHEPDGTMVTRHSPGFIKYLNSVLPYPIYPSGDFGLNELPAMYMNVGASGVNIGRHLYYAGVKLDKLADSAKFFAKIVNAAR